MHKENKGELDLSVTRFVKEFQQGKTSAVTEVYDSNYKKVAAFLANNQGSQEDVKDIFQEALTILWRRLKLKQFNPKSKSDIYGYLFSIARNKWMDHLRSSKFKRTDFLDKMNLEIKDNPSDLNKEYEIDAQIDRAMQALNQLDEACKSLLTEFYFNKKKMEAIAASLKMDPASVRNKKYRCMLKLKELVSQIES